MKIKIRLDTDSAAINLVNIATQFEKEKITVSDNEGNIVNAKSFLGTMYARFDFNEIWLETEKEHYFEFKDFIVEE